MRTRTVTHRAIIFSPFPSVRLLHHEINDLPFDWSEGVFLRGAYLSQAPVLMLIYIRLCLSMRVPFGVNENLCSECCGGLRIPGWSSFCPHWHEAFRNKLLTLPTCLLGSLLSPCLTELPQHANTLKGSSGFHGGHEEWEAHRLKPPVLLVHRHRASKVEPSQLTPNKLILPLSEPLSTSLFHPLAPSLFEMETSGAVPSGSVSK